MGNVCCESNSVKKLTKNKVLVTPAKINQNKNVEWQSAKGSNKKILDGNYHEIRTIGILNQGHQRTVSLVSVNQKIRGSSISERQFKLFVMASEKTVKCCIQDSPDQQLSTQISSKITAHGVDLKAIYPLKYTYEEDSCNNYIYELKKNNDLPTYLEQVTPYMMQFLLAAVVIKIEQDQIYDFRNLKAQNILIDGNGYPIIINQNNDNKGLNIWNLSLMEQYTSFLKIPYTNQYVTSGCFRQIHYEKQDDLKNSEKQFNFEGLPSYICNLNYHGKQLLDRIKCHEFFIGINWQKISSKRLESPFLSIIMRHNSFNESIFNQNY